MVEQYNIDLFDEELDRDATFKNVARFFKATQNRDSPFMRLVTRAGISYQSPQWSDMPRGGGNAGATDKMDKMVVAKNIIAAVVETIDNLPEKDFSRAIMKELYINGGRDKDAIMITQGDESHYYKTLKKLAFIRFAEAMDAKLLINGQEFCVYVAIEHDEASKIQ